MSFGASPSDIIIVVTFARRLYRQCRNAGGEYLEISREVRELHTVLKHLKYEVEAPESILNRDLSLYAKELAPLIGDCEFTLSQLDDLLRKYDRLGREGGTGRLWDKIRFGSAEMDQLGGIRMKLINHKTSITVFLDTIQLRISSRMSTTLDNHGGQLDVILDKVDKIAARMGQRATSTLTTYEDDDKEVWKQFRRELVHEGFSSDVLHQHKDVLRAYIREIDQNGLLDDMPPDGQSAISTGISPSHWMDSIDAQAHAPQLERPPPFESIHVNLEDTRAKEIVISEDNMKFPQSIKAQRLKVEPRSIGDEFEPMATSCKDSSAEHKENFSDPASSLPRLVTAVNQYKPVKASSPAVLMSTNELMAPNNYRLDTPQGNRRPDQSPEEGDQRVTSPSSPIDLRGSPTFGDERVSRSMAYRTPRATLAPELTPRGTSPSQYGSSPQSTRSRTSSLAPDSQGNEIPPDAKWTQVRRTLVSPEVLDQDKRRYEASPEFVAILGVLSRDEIEDYAVRSMAIREARRVRTSGQPPRQPPRPVEEQRRYAPTEAGDEDYSPDEREDERSRRSSHRERRSYPSAGPSYRPVPAYASSPSRAQTTPQQWATPSYGTAPMWIPHQGAPQYHYHLSPTEAQRPRSIASEKREKSKEKDRAATRSRWGANLTAAGIGGAAVSLLNVLAEAAEGL